MTILETFIVEYYYAHGNVRGLATKTNLTQSAQAERYIVLIAFMTVNQTKWNQMMSVGHCGDIFLSRFSSHADCCFEHEPTVKITT